MARDGRAAHHCHPVWEGLASCIIEVHVPCLSDFPQIGNRFVVGIIYPCCCCIVLNYAIDLTSIDTAELVRPPVRRQEQEHAEILIMLCILLHVSETDTILSTLHMSIILTKRAVLKL